MDSERYPKELSRSSIKYAESVLNETEEFREKCVGELRTWLETQKDLKASPEDDFLVAFLRGCKYNIEKTQKKIRKFYIIRGSLPQIFANRDPITERMQQLLKLGAFVPLRNYHEGLVVIIIRPACYDPKVFTFEEILKVGYVVLDICSRICPNLQVHGVYTIFDMKGVGLGHARPMTRTIIKLMVDSWENYHCRPKMLHFINAPFYINIVLNIFRSFMSQKLKDRICVTNANALLDIIDKTVLPEDYGGTDGTFQEHVDFWVKEVTEFGDWLVFDEQFKAFVETKKTKGDGCALNLLRGVEE